LKSLFLKGLIGSSAILDDVLGLSIEDMLDRRLQSIVKGKGIVTSIYAARQAVVHGNIKVGDRRVTVPGFLVNLNEEPTVRIREGSSLANLMVSATAPQSSEVK